MIHLYQQFSYVARCKHGVHPLRRAHDGDSWKHAEPIGFYTNVKELQNMTCRCPGLDGEHPEVPDRIDAIEEDLVRRLMASKRLAIKPKPGEKESKRQEKFLESKYL